MQRVRAKLRTEKCNGQQKQNPPPSYKLLWPTTQRTSCHLILFFCFFLSTNVKHHFHFWLFLCKWDCRPRVLKVLALFHGGRRVEGGGGGGWDATIGWKLWAAVNYPASRKLHSDLIRADKWQISSQPSESRRTFAFPYYCPDSKCHICSSVFPKRLLFHNIAPPPPAHPNYQGCSIKAQLMRI